MHPLEKKFQAVVRDTNLFLPGDRVLVGFSGGPDSTALLLLLAGLRSVFSISLAALYVNHGLRPAAATAADEEHVRNVCRALDVRLAIRRLDVARVARARRTGVEDAARVCRHAALRTTAQRLAASRIALGHTADDQAEELLLRLVRGAGRGGLAGMRFIRDGLLVRPLLSFRKQELLAFLRDRGVGFCHDESNDDLCFVRNRIRRRLLPFLAAEFNPNITTTLVHTADILRQEDELLARLAGQAAQEIVLRPADRPEIRLRRRRLLATPVALVRRVLEQVLIELGCPPRFEHVEAVRRLALAPPGKRLHLPRGLRVRGERDVLVLLYPQGRRRVRGDLETVF